jgi:hypothetical protein
MCRHDRQLCRNHGALAPDAVSVQVGREHETEGIVSAIPLGSDQHACLDTRNVTVTTIEDHTVIEGDRASKVVGLDFGNQSGETFLSAFRHICLCLIRHFCITNYTLDAL